METKRKSNIELLRIVAMLFIIIHHLIINGIGWTNIAKSNIQDNYLLYTIGGGIESFVIIGVNLFFLISGYFKINFSWKKLLKILFVIYVYMISIQVFGILVGYQKMNVSLIKQMLLPLESYWFIKVYLVLMLLSPLLNLVVENAKRSHAKYFMLIYFIVFCAYTFLDNSEHLGVNRGYSLISACCFYLIGAFINKGILFSTETMQTKHYIIGYIIVGLCNTVLIQLAIQVLEYGKLATVLLVYNNPLIAMESICFFLAFTKLELKEEGKLASIIRYISKNTLAVYILHSSNEVIPYYRNIPLAFLVSRGYIFEAFICIIPYAWFIFFICIYIDKFFNIMLGHIINKLSNNLGGWLDKQQDRICL